MSTDFTEKKVHLRRKEPAKSHLPVEVIMASKRKLGSHFVGRGPLRGLNKDQERQYLPTLAGFDPDSKEWEKQTRAFWNEYFIDVPFEGVVLDISLLPNGTPRVLEDWVKWNWAKQHKLVALSEDAMKSSPTKQFYIFDPEEADKKANEEVGKRKLAYTEFINLVSEQAREKMNWVYRLLLGINPERLNFEQLENILEEQARTNPEKFYTVVTDKNLSIRSTLLEMIELRILRRIGNHVFFNDNKIGETMEEAIEFVKSAKNSETVAMLKAQLAEKRANPGQQVEVSH